MKKIFLFIVFTFLYVTCCFSHDVFDLFSTKYSYVFEEKKPKGFMSFVPGEGAFGALEKWRKGDYEIDIMYHWNKLWNADDILFFLIMENKHQTFTIDKMNVEYEGNNKLLFENRIYYLPTQVYSVEESDKAQESCFLTNGRLYWTRLEFCKPINPKEKYPHVHWKKIFKGYKDWDRFPCKVRLKYHFDEEESKEIVFSYDVLVQKW